MSIHSRFMVDPLRDQEIQLEEEETPAQATERRQRQIAAARTLLARREARMARTGQLPAPVTVPPARPSLAPWIAAGAALAIILATAILSSPLPPLVAGGW